MTKESLPLDDRVEQGQPVHELLGNKAPAWMRDIQRFLSVRSHFVLSGNVSDLVLVPKQDIYVPMTLPKALSAFLEACGYDFLLSYDPFDLYELVDPTPEKITKLERMGLGLSLGEDGRMKDSSGRPPDLREVMKELVASPKPRGALLVGHAARLGEDEKTALFGSSLKLSQRTKPILMPDGKARFAPVFWIVDSVVGDLPSWFVLKNERVRTLTIQLPSLESRERAAEVLASEMDDYDTIPEAERSEYIKRFAKETEGLTIEAMLSADTLARDQGYGLSEIQNAVRLYKVGIVENRWDSPALRKQIAAAEGELSHYVKGQSTAIQRTVNILVRSVMGLNAAGKPRGVLFLAGPTGVGKTELAKALSRLLFGDAEAYIRFDMSEFSQEHAESRLIGAPPGYVGYGKGGELTKAVMERPQSVILFDEIEKADSRLFDKFLQILDDGRLTDGEGRTAYFSESIIVFTSNLGIYKKDDKKEKVLNVSPDTPRDKYADNIKREIEKFFKEELGRPELFGRLGDKVVVFDFITQEVGNQIFEKNLQQVISNIKEQRKVDLVLPAEVKDALARHCVSDLSSGGRGILARLEAALVDPLAAALFKRGSLEGSELVVADISIDTPNPRITLS